MALPIDFSAGNPFRTLDWRYQRAQQVFDTPDARCGCHDDRQTRDLEGFLRAHDAAQFDPVKLNCLQQERFAEHVAYEFFRLRHPYRFSLTHVLEARLLAGQSDKEIAHNLHTVVDVPGIYHNWFFDVRPCLQAHDHIFCNLIRPAFAAAATAEAEAEADAEGGPFTNPSFCATMKLFAYFGGPRVLDAMLSGFARDAKPSSAGDVDQWFARSHTVGILRHAAMAMETVRIDNGMVMKLSRLANQLIKQAGKKANKKIKAETKFDVEAIAKAMVGEVPWLVEAGSPKPQKRDSSHSGGAEPHDPAGGRKPQNSDEVAHPKFPRLHQDRQTG